MKQFTAESYQFFADTLPDGVQPTRAHAVLVMPDGRILLRWKNDEARMTGGHIEPTDEDWQAALRREALEETSVEIDRIDYLGYLEVTTPDLHEYWLRAVARVKKILPATPDPDRDGNWIYGRRLVSLETATIEYEKSMPAGDTRKIVELAVQTAREKGYFTMSYSDIDEVINPESRDLE